MLNFARFRRSTIVVVLFAELLLGDARAADDRPPNVILIMTDDQGYGDLGCHGNKVINTPALDRLYAQSVRLRDYHVDPTCSPTRSALLTGRYSSRTGVWHTIMGRSMMHKDEVTMGDVFAASGYRTAIFGKWHLGDNYPLRPQDRGFHEVLIHGGGGITQTPDFWDNDYFDDTYWHNGVPQKYSGYCTDVFFDGALSFIEQNKQRPFFVYLPTNAAHGPFHVAKKYSQPYKDRGVPSPRAEFYGMLTNIDDNIARLRSKLRQWGLSENTIFIFTTDNGTAAGTRGGGGFNAGMRGTKGSEYEGGHRVPFFIHWPQGNLTGGRNVSALCAHIDVLPTLVDLCQLKQPKKVDIDGKSLASVLGGRQQKIRNPQSAIRNRTLFVHSQRVEHPQKWRKSTVMTHRWRLINGKELFDIQADAGQKKNIASDHPQVVEQLRGKYDGWWQHISDRFDDYVRIELGSPQADPTLLTCHDWHTNNAAVPWNQGAIRRDQTANGFWAVDVVRAGEYEITLRSRPAHVNHPLNPGTARILIGAVDRKLPIKQGATAVTFRVPLKAGTAKLQTWLDETSGTKRGAYFVTVRRVE